KGFMGIEYVEVVPKKTVTVIGGRNRQGKCIPEGTNVCLWDGSRKQIQNVRETDLLVGLDYNNLEFQPESPLRLATSGVQEGYELKTAGGFSIQLTAGHRILGTTGWRQLSACSVGDYVAIPLRLPASCNSTGRECAEAMMIGLLLGDGGLTIRCTFTVG